MVSKSAVHMVGLMDSWIASRNDDHSIQDPHDILQSYYKVARKRFVDSLRMQAADYYLTAGPRTPLKLFSPAFVAEMTPTQLEEVAGEDLTLKRRRMQLERESPRIWRRAERF